MEIYLSVIVPTYNEEENIGGTLKIIFEYLSRKEFSWEVLVIDDGSVDRTVELVRAFPVKLLENGANFGKGRAVRRGMLESGGRFRLFTDADCSTPIEELDKFLPFAEEGWDIVIGTRRLQDSRIELDPPFYRHFLGEIYVGLTKLIMRTSVSDFNCGFKLFSAYSAQKLFSIQKMDRWSFDAEILFLARTMGFSVKEVPVRWAHRQKTSKVKPLTDGLRSFRDLFLIRFNYALGKYGKEPKEGTL